MTIYKEITSAEAKQISMDNESLPLIKLFNRYLRAAFGDKVVNQVDVECDSHSNDEGGSYFSVDGIDFIIDGEHVSGYSAFPANERGEFDEDNFSHLNPNYFKDSLKLIIELKKEGYKSGYTSYFTVDELENFLVKLENNPEKAYTIDLYDLMCTVLNDYHSTNEYDYGFIINNPYKFDKEEPKKLFVAVDS